MGDSSFLRAPCLRVVSGPGFETHRFPFDTLHALDSGNRSTPLHRDKKQETSSLQLEMRRLPSGCFLRFYKLSRKEAPFPAEFAFDHNLTHSQLERKKPHVQPRRAPVWSFPWRLGMNLNQYGCVFVKVAVCLPTSFRFPFEPTPCDLALSWASAASGLGGHDKPSRILTFPLVW